MTRPLSPDIALDSSPDSPIIWRSRLGRELRRLREASGLQLEDAAGKLDLVASSLSRIERGQAPAKNNYLPTMFRLYGVSNLAQRKLLMDMARRGQSKGWWWPYNELLQPEAQQYLGLEAAANGTGAAPATRPEAGTDGMIGQEDPDGWPTSYGVAAAVGMGRGLVLWKRRPDLNAAVGLGADAVTAWLRAADGKGQMQ